MEWGQEKLGVRVGYASAVDCKILVVSLLSDVVDLQCDGVTYSVSLIPIGTDNPLFDQACFTGMVKVSNLSANTLYTFEVNQGAAQVTGSFRTLPDKNSDYSLFFVSCDNLVSNSTPTGFYSYIKRYSEEGDLPVVAVAHLDDVVYADGAIIDDSQYTGHQSSDQPMKSLTSYDRSLCYMAYFGLFGDRINKITRIGHCPDRKWVYRNTNLWAQWGDHEFSDNIGWKNVAKSDPNWQPGINVWDAFFGQIMPPRMRNSGHVEAQHWGISLGSLYVASSDRVTKGEGGREKGQVLFGDDQINDLLSGFSGPEVFKIFNINNSIRYLADGLSNTVERGANQPLADERVNEYEQLFTNIGGLQDMSNNMGFKFLTIHGDHHNPYVHFNRNSVGVIPESFCDVVVGTVNGSRNHAVDPTLSIGVVRNNSEIMYMDDSRDASTSSWSGARVDIYSSKGRKEMHVTLIDRREREVWKGVWREGPSSNLPKILDPSDTLTGCE